MHDRVADKCSRAVEALQSGLGEDLVAVALFGSQARGDAHEGSDIDLLFDHGGGRFVPGGKARGVGLAVEEAPSTGLRDHVGRLP